MKRYRVLKAGSGEWETSNSKGDKFVVRVGIITERRNDCTVWCFILGSWQFAWLHIRRAKYGDQGHR